MSREPRFSANVYDGYVMTECADEIPDLGWYHAKLVKCRKDHECLHCGGLIRKGDWALYEKVVIEGYPMGFHGCLDCVENDMEKESGNREGAENQEDGE